jgi:hypothetical protein
MRTYEILCGGIGMAEWAESLSDMRAKRGGGEIDDSI